MCTHSIPHDYVDVVIEGSINVLRSKQVEEITIVMIQINPYRPELRELLTPCAPKTNAHWDILISLIL